MRESRKPSKVPALPGGSAWVLVSSTLWGLGVSLVDQITTLLEMNRFVLPWVSAALVLAVFWVIALASALLSAPLRWVGGGPAVRRASGVLLAAYAVGLIAFAASEEAISRSVLGPAAALGLISALAVAGGRAGSPRRSGALLCALLALVLLWSLKPPEAALLGEGAGVAVVFVVLVGLVALAFELRRVLPISAVAELVAVGIAVVAVVAVRAGGGPPAPSSGVPAPETPADGVERPNIILIVWDTVRRDHLSAYGYSRPTTPYLEARLPDSRVYTRAVSVAPWTLPAHASIFTGLYPRQHGAHFIGHPGMREGDKDYRDLPEDAETLAEILSGQGYACGAVSANYLFASARNNLDQGFHHFSPALNMHSLSAGRFHFARRKLIAAWLPWLPRLLWRHFVPYLPAEDVNREALAWLDALGDRRPFFLFLNYMDAHGPNFPPTELVDRFPGYQADLVERDIWAEMLAEKRPITPRERDHLVSQYDASLVYLDFQLEDLERQLRERGLLSDTIVVLTSDHGEFLGEHGLVGHERDLYEEVLAIPLMVWGLRGPAPGRDPVRIENRELFFMILGWAGIERRSPAHPWEAAAEIHARHPPRRRDGSPIELFLRTRRAVYRSEEKSIHSSDGAHERYDLGRDPGESRNLWPGSGEADSGAAPELARRFLTLIPEWSGPQEAVESLTEAEREELRALGYLP